MGKVVEINDGTFENEIIKCDIPAVVDFGAEWCRPCKAMEPLVEEAARDFKGRVKFGKINMDDNAKTATELTVMNIPALVFFKNGEEAGRAVGVISKKALYDKIEGLLND